MRRFAKFFPLLGALGFGVAHAGVIESRADVLNPEWVTDINYLYRSDAVVFPAESAADGPRFRVDYTADRGRIRQDFSTPLDWSGKDMLTWCVTNRENRQVNLILMFQVRANQNDYTGSMAYEMVVPANQTVRYVMVFRETDPRQFGVKYFPQVFDTKHVRINVGSSFARNSIYSWRIIYSGGQPASVSFSDFSTLVMKRNMDGIADQFFQYAYRDWPGKTRTVQDMVDARTQETVDLAANPGPGNLDGSNTLPNQGTSARWRVGTVNGKRYLISPAGKPFWSFGLQGIHDIMSTWTDGRSSMFQSLPSPSGPDGDLYGTQERYQGQGGGTVTSFDIVKYNLRRKYGSDYFGVWSDRMKLRLKSWGFNTAAAWCDDFMYDNSVPYTFFVDTYDYPTRLDVPSIAWMKLPDPYAANFESWMVTKFRDKLRNHNGRSNFMGIFVDNEQSWGHIMDGTDQSRYAVALGALKAPASQPAKVALVQYLTTKYSSVTRLNNAWRTRFSSWNSVKAPVNMTPANFNAALVGDLRGFTQRLASTYFTKVKRALNTSGCTALYMGCRFWYYTPEILAAAAQSVDVLSFNNYSQSDSFPWAMINGLNKPVIISEWSNPINAEGSIGWNQQTTEEATGVIFNMVSTALRQRNVVGMHWYEAYDMPVTGHAAHYWNVGFGILDICDRPKPEVVEATRAIGNQMYTIRG